MFKKIFILTVSGGLLVACGGGNSVVGGIASLGEGFARAFGQDANAEPLPLDNITLAMTTTVEPFNP